MLDKLFLKIRERYDVSDDEERLLTDAMKESRNFSRGDIIVPEDERIAFSSLLVSGIAARSKYLEDGKRQILEISIPGDFVDLHSYPLEWLDHSVTALSDCRIVKLPHVAISQAIEQSPRLARILWFITMVDASIHREWLVSMGSRSALERAAHLLCELFYRLRSVKLTEGRGYPLTLNQSDLAETLGLSKVHVSRTLKELRERELVEIHGARVKILDFDGLQEVAGFDPGYLYLQRREH